MVLIESENFPNKDAVMSSWGNYPFPDKYNKHNVDTKSVNFDAIKLTDAEMLAGGFLKDKEVIWLFSLGYSRECLKTALAGFLG